MTRWCHRDDRAHDIGDHDPEKDLDLGGAIHAGGLRISSGMPLSAAENSTMAKPACSQTTITTRKRLFQGADSGKGSPGLGLAS